MKEDYLWDKSGAPDPELEQLEQSLGRLRYQVPKEPLQLPLVSRASFRRPFSLLTAVAAAIVVLLIASGLWVNLRGPADPKDSRVDSGPAPKTGPIEIIANGDPEDADRKVPAVNGTPEQHKFITLRQPRPRHPVARHTETARERARRAQQLAIRGELAKEQLIKALLITSDKLNTVQKKIQGAQEESPIS